MRVQRAAVCGKYIHSEVFPSASTSKEVGEVATQHPHFVRLGKTGSILE